MLKPRRESKERVSSDEYMETMGGVRGLIQPGGPTEIAERAPGAEEYVVESRRDYWTVGRSK